MAHNVLEPSETKYFLSNASPGVPLPVILHVAFSRWSVERCLEDEKSELGLSHFEVRCYPALTRHLLITQVSHLSKAAEFDRAYPDGLLPHLKALGLLSPRIAFAHCVYARPEELSLMAEAGASEKRWISNAPRSCWLIRPQTGFIQLSCWKNEER